MKKSSLLFIFVGLACVAASVVGVRTATPGRQTGLAGASAQATARSFAIRDVRLFDGERVVERATVLVRNGRIAEIGGELAVAAGTEIVDGSGRTLLPGFIDSHTHTFGDALERALVYGVTTELDMFTDQRQAAQWRAEQRSTGAPRRADILSAGTLVTAPGGHGTQFGLPIPTLTSASDALTFVDARIAEGSDYIKVVYEDGSAYGMKLPSIGEDALRAVIRAARSRNKLVVVHVGSQAAAKTAISAQPNGLVHIFADAAAEPAFVEQVRAAGAFVIPTLSVIESVGGTSGGAGVARHPVLAPFVTAAERTALDGKFPQRAGNMVKLEHALDAVRLLRQSGVPILAGSDAPNPGTIHGGTIHRELELLVRAGLSPAAALAAATSVPAKAFGLHERGRIVSGARADLVLVDGNPAQDITATRAIVAVWKGGTRLDRQPASPEEKSAGVVTSGEVSDFDRNDVSAAFGAGWQISTDTLFGGASEATMLIVESGASGSRGSLEVTGTIKPGAPFPWAGAMFFPASPPMSPANLSRFKELVFWTRGDGRQYRVMMFATSLGNIPAAQSFEAGPAWREVVLPLKAFGMDGSDLRGILFSADAKPGAFAFQIDTVRLR